MAISRPEEEYPVVPVHIGVLIGHILAIFTLVSINLVVSGTTE